MNIEIRSFQDDITNYINQSQIPLEVKRLVIRDIYIQLERVCNDVISQERLMKEQENLQEGQNDIVEEATV